MINQFYTFLIFFLVLYSTYQLASLAGIFSERSGVANIAIEGNMIVGAVLFMSFAQNLEGMNQLPAFFISLIASMALSSTYMLLLGLATNRYMSDHIVAGTAMNLLAPALMMMLFIFTNNQYNYEAGKSISNIYTVFNDRSWYIPLTNSEGEKINEINYMLIFVVVLALVAALISSFVISKTKFGLRLKSSGENPYSLETSGVSVAKTRLQALLIAGLLSSLAGVAFIMRPTNTFAFTVKGSGFLAIGIIILGQYRVSGAFIGSVVLASLIGLCDTVQYYYVSDPIIGSYTTLVKGIPFLIPIIGLILFRKSYIPSGVGKNFKKDQR